MKNNFDFDRKKIISKIKKYTKKLDTKSVDYCASSHLYFSSQESTLCHSKINNWLKKKNSLFLYIISLFKNLLSISFFSEPKLINNNSNLDYDYIVKTWGKKNNFKKNGSLDDRYFKINSRKYKKILWLVIYLDDNLPRKIDNNIFIIQRKKNKFPNIIFLINYFFKNLINCRLNILKLFHSLSSQTCYAYQNLKLIKPIFKKYKIKNVIMPYEGQPFQNLIFYEVKKINQDIRTVGYVAYTHPFQTELLNRNGAPDQIFIYSPDQLNFFKKLNWDKNDIKLIPSLNYKRGLKIKKQLRKKIFFPYKINNKRKIILSIKNLNHKLGNDILKKFIVAMHPSPDSKTEQVKLKESILKILRTKTKNKNNSSYFSKDTIIVLGLSTTIFLALENNLNVLHVSLDPFRDKLSKNIWPSVMINQISKDIFLYSLRKKNNCILMKNENKFKELLN